MSGGVGKRDVSARGSVSRNGANIAFLFLVVIGFIFRLAPLGRYVTPDEPSWVYRSIRFGDAVAAGDWKSVPSTGHPGVTTMWLGAAGVAAQRLLKPAESLAHLDWIRRLAWLAPENGEALHRLAFFLSGGRVAVALVTMLGLSAAYLLLARLLDRRIALLSLGLWVFDPFLTGHAGLLHTDALLAVFSLLTLLLALNGLDGRRLYIWWPLAGFSAGLALLTKTPGGILIPFVGGVVVSHVFIHPDSWKRLGIGLFLFLVGAIVTVFVGYPALWGDAAGVFRTTYSFAGRLVEAAPRPIFFAGRMTLDPGPAFYPIVFLFRISPVVLIGLLAGLASWRRLRPIERVILLVSVGFAVVYGAGMSPGSKMHDRYLLPAFLPLVPGAALGIGVWIDRFRGRLQSLRILQRRYVLVLPVLFQAIIGLAFVARPLTYYNPLLGGPMVASRILPTGWGERWGTAARWMNRLPEADQLTVAAASVPSFAPLFDGRTVPWDGDDGDTGLADYVVAPYDRSFGMATYRTIDCSGCRRPTAIYTNTAPLEQAEYLADRVEPGALVLLDADIPLRRRYEGPGLLLSAASLPDEATVADWLTTESARRETIWLVASPAASPITAAHLRTQLGRIATQVSSATIGSATIACYEVRHRDDSSSVPSYRAAFGGQLALVDVASSPAAAWPRELRIYLRWRALAVPPADYQTSVSLLDDEGHTWTRVESLVRNDVNFPTSAWAPGEWSDTGYALDLPAGIPPGRYNVEVSVYDHGSGARLAATDQPGSFLGTRVPVGEVAVRRPIESPDIDELDISEHLGIPAGALRLVGMSSVSEEVLSGDSLSLDLFWQAEDVPKSDYRVRMRLTDSRHEVGLEFVAPLSPYPTSRWKLEDRFQAHYDLQVLPSVSPGDWQVMFNVVDEEGDSLWEEDRALATLEVVARERGFVLPADIPHQTDISFGGSIHLRGYGVVQETVSAGESIPLTLYWEAEGPTERDYTLFVHLIGPGGELVGQVDRVPGNGAAPTSTWAEGQVIVGEVALPTAPSAETGRYRIAVGFYDAAYGERLSVTDVDGRDLPENQAILPVEIEVAG